MNRSQTDVRTLAITAIMIALVAVITRFVVVPIGTGFFNFSDVAIYFTAFAFGPWVGLVAGGVGAALADISLGYTQFAILTFLAHGLEGLVAGYVGRDQTMPRMVAGWALGAVTMAGLYFLGEALVPVLGGLPQAVSELPWNVLQNIGGGIVGIALVLAVRRAYPPISQFGPGRS